MQRTFHEEAFRERGSEGTRTYTNVSHGSVYRIRTDNLASEKKADVNDYINAIKTINSSMATAKAYAVLSGIGIQVVIGIVGLCIAFPPATIVAAVVTAVGGGLSAGVVALVKSTVDYVLLAFAKYEDVEDLYVTIITYGTKI